LIKIFRKLFILLFLVCSIYGQTSEIVFIQLNDVYEIAPLEGGKFGGFARVKTIIDKIKKTNPYTYVILSGDFISPSALSTSTYEDKRINGRQMVEVLNAIGLNYVTFGNHEFDYKLDVLQDRMNQSDFKWFSSNVMQSDKGTTFSFNQNGTDLPKYLILNSPGYLKNHPIRLGVVGICIDANKQPYVSYNDYYESAKQTYGMIKDSIDYLIGITHLSIDEDKKLAGELPQLRLIMGGHEHVNMYHKAGETIITKADANARTIYVHRLIFNEQNTLIVIKSELINIDETVPEDPTVKELVDEWTFRAFKGFMDKGFDPLKMVYDLKNDTLDGREETIRYGQAPLGYLIANAMYSISPGADLAFFNSGAIRIDDQLTGEITQYDIIRVLPYGGKIFQVEMKGSLLKQVIETGFKQPGSGGYLLYYGLEGTQAGYKVRNELIDDNKTYHAAVSDYLMSGLEQNLGFLNKDNPGIVKITEPDPSNKSDLCNDIRFAVINYFEKWKR
jgi:2',3'-cyclic-nucleotide 2'-phosphodiesterase (5'-nucleotidase family)